MNSLAETIGAASPACAAWLDLRETLISQRETLLRHEWSKHPLVRAQGLYYLQSMEASAFNMYVAPRQQYPALYVQSMFMPFELSWGLHNPDFLNHNGFIDGRKTYRIYGNRKGNHWTTIQVFRGFYGDELQGNLAHVDFDDLPEAPDGSFEILLGPDPSPDKDATYWVELDPNSHNIMLATREVFYDWQKQPPIELHIETLDRDPVAPMVFDEVELTARIQKAHKYLIYNFKLATGEFQREQAGVPIRYNEFAVNSSAGSHGGNPLAAYANMVYGISPEDALIVEMPVVEARYWGIQTGSVWLQSNDFSYHKSSINGAQAFIDSDGVFRAVISLEDPGVPNWLNPVGLSLGVAQIRWYKAHAAVTATVQKIPLKRLRAHLPGDTPHVTPEQRRQELDVRRRASLRRYGQ